MTSIQRASHNRSPSLVDILEARTLMSGYTTSLVAPIPTLTKTNANTQTQVPFARDSAGNLFNVDPYGGTPGSGTAYEVNPNTKSLTVITTFGLTGAQIPLQVVVDSKGNLFGISEVSSDGTTLYNGGGTVFELPVGNYATPSILYTFTAAAFSGSPVGTVPRAIIIDSHDNVDVLTSFGGANNGGTIDQFQAADNYAVPHVLGSLLEDYHSSAAALVLAPNGTFYGATAAGGANASGSLWSLAADQSVTTTIASFDSNKGPSGTIFADAQNNLFGTSPRGGPDTVGSVWEFTSSTHQLSTIAVFPSSTGLFPEGGVTGDSSGNIFGTAEQGSAFFKVDASSHALTFTALSNTDQGTSPFAAPTPDDAGNFFISTTAGGANNHGAVVEISPGGSTGGGGGGTSTGTTVLTPIVANSVVPTTVVSGSKLKASVTVNVTNTGSGISKGKDTVTLYATTTGAIDSASLQLTSASKSLTLKPGKKGTIKVSFKTLAIPAGNYTILASTTDAAGVVTSTTSGPAVAVADPFILISAAVGPVAPSTVKVGGSGGFQVTFINAGNIASTGLATISIGLSTDGTTVTIPLTPLKKSLNLQVNKPLKLKLHFKIAKTFNSTGIYFPIITFTQGSATITAAGTVPFTVG